MIQTNWGEWDEVAKKVEGGKGNYFTIVEGVNKFVLLSHIAPLAQVFDATTRKYRIAVAGDKNVSVKGVCWVLQKESDVEGNIAHVIKEAKLPYTAVKAIRELAEDPDWNFELPFKHPLTLTALGAGSQEVKYTLTPSPKEFEIPQEVLTELATKPTPEEVVEKIKGGAKDEVETKASAYTYPDDDVNPDDSSF